MGRSDGPPLGAVGPCHADLQAGAVAVLAEPVGLGKILGLPGRGASRDQRIDLGVIVGGGAGVSDPDPEGAGQIDDRGHQAGRVVATVDGGVGTAPSPEDRGDGVGSDSVGIRLRSPESTDEEPLPS